jgi:hypothetical protein
MLNEYEVTRLPKLLKNYKSRGLEADGDLREDEAGTGYKVA